MEANVRLLIADIDGTLVTPEKVLTRRSIEAVKWLRDAGVAFTITSGRPPLGMKGLMDQLPLTGPAVARELVDTFLAAEFSGAERHVRRLGKVCRSRRAASSTEIARS
jgi:phosphoglycolate phosphatase-like HAD superfamily hydrolase